MGFKFSVIRQKLWKKSRHTIGFGSNRQNLCRLSLSGRPITSFTRRPSLLKWGEEIGTSNSISFAIGKIAPRRQTSLESWADFERSRVRLLYLPPMPPKPLADEAPSCKRDKLVQFRLVAPFPKNFSFSC